MPNKTKLFSPISLRSVTFENRIVVSPMGQYSADRDGLASEWHPVHVGNLALSGAGLVLIEATAVEPRGRVSGQCLGIWSDEHAKALEKTVAFCRSEEHTSELQSLMRISYAVFCLKKKNIMKSHPKQHTNTT